MMINISLKTVGRVTHTHTQGNLNNEKISIEKCFINNEYKGTG